MVDGMPSHGTTLVSQNNDTVSQYVDLGLPSGTLWKIENEGIGYYNYYDAKKAFGDSLPTLNQWKELMNVCEWKWMGKGFDVIGPNGNSIYLPAPGERYCSGVICCLGESGKYWSSTLSSSYSDYSYYYAMEIYKSTENYREVYKTSSDSYKDCFGFAVRLVKTK